MNSNKRRLIVDSSAWIEYLRGSERGLKIKRWLDDPTVELITLDTCVAEIKYWFLSKEEGFASILAVLDEKSTIVNSGLQEWLEAADLKFEKRKVHSDIGLVDVLQMVHARKLGARLISTDAHFAGEKKAIVV